MMPQSGQKLISRFFTDSTGPATMWVPLNPHTLNPNPWISQLRSAGAHTDTFSPMCTHQPLAWLDFSPGASDMQVLFYMVKKKETFKASETEVFTPYSAAVALPAWISRLLLLVLLRAEGAGSFGKPVVPINVGNTITRMGNHPSPGQEAGEPFSNSCPLQRMLLISNSLQQPLTLAAVSKAPVGQLCWFYQTPL